MGNAQVPRVDEPRVFLTEYTDLVYQDVLGSYKLFKVMQCVHEQEGLVVVKLFIHRDGAPKLTDVQEKVLQVKEAFGDQWLHPNVVPYQGMEITGRSAILLRQHFARNLYDRMHTRPFLSEMTRNWMAFQVLCSVCQAHSAGVAHGDLKTENVFVSSWNHVILSDFALFKPLFLPDDDPSEFSFFFESNLNRRRCYLAPERFTGRSTGLAMHEPFSRELAAMDVFSLGCVLAELFLDGQTLMDLPELLLYRANQLDLHAKIAGIGDPAVRELIGSMLHRDPSHRRLAIEYLQEWCERVAPRSFCSCLFPLSVILLHPIYQQPDMRIVMLRRNFANILWSIVGPRKISQALSSLPSPSPPPALESLAGSIVAAAAAEGGALGGTTATTWERWYRHIERSVRRLDEATLRSASLHGAGQWRGASSVGEPGGSRASSVGQGIQNSTLEDFLGGVEEEALFDGSVGPGMSSKLTQPWLREKCCEGFMRALLGNWEQGCRRCIDRDQIAGTEYEATAFSRLTSDPGACDIYCSFMTELCSPGDDHPASLDSVAAPRDGEEEPPPASEQQPPSMPGSPSAGPSVAEPSPAPAAAAALGASEREDVLGILCGLICPSLQHVSNPRLKVVCLDMFEQISPFTSQSTVLEQIVPYIHVLMTDSVAKVRARAIEVLPRTLERIEELPSNDTLLFMEYIFPQLLSAISGINNSEPVMLLAIARNIGALAQHAVRFAELSVAAAQRASRPQEALGSEHLAQRGDGAAEHGKRGNEATKTIEVEAFDVQWKHLRETVKKVVKTLLEYSPVGMQTGTMGSDSEGQAPAGVHEESLLNLTMAREIKIALLRNMLALADIFGRDGTHNFLLPYLISFMNDQSWEVRAAFCEEAAGLPKKVGQVSAEGIIWPCFEQALLDQEEHVVEAALRGLSVLVSQQILKRQLLQTVASKVAPLLVHPSDLVRQCAADVFEALTTQLSEVDQFVFLTPIVRPFLRVELPSLGSKIGLKLSRPLGRQLFKKAMLHRDGPLLEALLKKRPLPARVEGEEDLDLDKDLEALELFRPYLEPLLRLRPTLVQMTGGASHALKDDGSAFAVPPTIVRTLQYATVNPECVANRSLQALAEFDGEGPTPSHSSSSPSSASGCGGGSAATVAVTEEEFRRPLTLFSMCSFLVQALRLPPRPRDLGSLNYLDGTPYSIYAAGASRAGAGGVAGGGVVAGGGGVAPAGGGGGAPVTQGGELPRRRTDRDSSGGGSGGQDSSVVLSARQGSGTDVMYESAEPPCMEPAIGGAIAGLPGVAAMAASERKPGGSFASSGGSGGGGSGVAGQQPRRSREGQADLLSGLAADSDVEGTDCAGRSSRMAFSAHAPWRPRGVLLATLYEYAHQGGVPVVKVDTTDDSRILVTGGKDGVVKLWNCAMLERDVAVSSSLTFVVPGGTCDGAASARRKQRLRALRTVRNSKAFAVGSESGDVFLYKIEAQGTSAPQVCRFPGDDKHSACQVMCIEQFDTELESLVVFAQQHGRIQGWDVRSRSPSWSLCSVPPWLGVPNCLALGSDGHAITIGTLGGGLLVYDLRFLAPWKQWKVSSGAAVLSLKSSNFRLSSGPGVFVALGSDSNEIAFFDVVRGSCLTLFSTEPVADRQKEAAVSVPSLLDTQTTSSSRGQSSQEQFHASPPGAQSPAGCVRAMWLPARGAQTYLLASGMDRKVRHWSLDLERHTADAYIVTPPDSLSPADKMKERPTYSSNRLGDVFVVQEQSTARGGDVPSRGPSKPAAVPGGGPQGVPPAGAGLAPFLGVSGHDELMNTTNAKSTNPNHRDAILDMCSISLQNDILVTAGRDGLVKLWK